MKVLIRKLFFFPVSFLNAMLSEKPQYCKKSCCYGFKFRRYMENQFKTWQEVNVFFDSKSDSLYRSLFKIWLFSKALVGKLFFFHFFQQLLVFEKTHNCKSWRFHEVKWTKSSFLKAKLFLKSVFSQINFTWKPDPL